MASTIAATIDGTTVKLKLDTLRISRRTQARKQATFKVIDRAAALSFEWRNPVNITFDGETIFDGWVDSIETTSVITVGGVSEGLVHRVKCVDHHYLLDKRVVVDEWSNVTAGSIVNELITNILGDEGVTAGTVSDGATVENYRADHKSCDEVLADLAALSDFYYDIDFSRVLTFEARPTTPSGSTIEGSDMIRGTVKLVKRSPSYRNKEYVIGEEDTSDAPDYVDDVIEDQVSNLASGGDHPKYSTSQIVVKVNSPPLVKVHKVYTRPDTVSEWTEVTVARDDQDPLPDTDFYYEHLGNFVWRNPSKADLASTDYVRIEYVYSYDRADDTQFGDGATRVFTVPTTLINNPDEGFDKPRVEIKWSGDTYFTVEEIAEKDVGGEDWLWDKGGNEIIDNREAGSTNELQSDEELKVTWVSEVVATAAHTNDSEITAQKAREGATTTGIVEHVVSNFEAPSTAVMDSIGEGELNRWAHNLRELNFKTWDSTVIEGVVKTINAPDLGISNLDFFIERVVLTGQDTRGTKDEKSSPIMYTVSAVRSEAGGAAGGSMALSPKTGAELFRRVNDKTRVRSLRANAIT